MLMTKPTELVFSRRWPFGVYEHQENQDSLLFRPYRRLGETGAPMGTLNHLFLPTGEPFPRTVTKGLRLLRLWDTISPARRHPILRTTVRLLGTLCYSDGGMILYFPGYHAWQPGKGGIPFLVDHFSLEPGLDRWHITGVDKSRVRYLGVKEIAPDLIYWFAISVQEALKFELIYRESTFTFPCPDSDARRRMCVAISATKDAVFNIIECPDARLDDGPSFWHIEFAVKRGAPPDLLPSFPLHLPPVPLADVRTSAQLPVRAHTVRLVGFDGTVLITATRISGRLTFPFILGHP